MTTPESRVPVQEKRQASPGSGSTANYIVPPHRLQVIFLREESRRIEASSIPKEQAPSTLVGSHAQ